MSATPSRRLLIGVGNAGVGVLDRITVEHPSFKGLLVINNDMESLEASVVLEQIVFPYQSGGGLTDAFLAIEEDFGRAISGASSVILCGGLGGETGSFLLPALAARAKASGMTTLASVGIPFSFEGRQKRELASEALKKLYDFCDGVIVIDNDRISGGVPSTAAIGEAFISADRILQSSLLALQGMISTAGPVKITRHDLASALGHYGNMTHFGHGRAQGANRLHEALEAALKSPLLTLAGKGSALKEAESLLLLLRGPSDLSFAEVQRAVSEVERFAGDRAQVKVGVHAVEPIGSALEIFLITSSRKTKSASPKGDKALFATLTDQTMEREESSGKAASVKGHRDAKLTKSVKPNAVQQTQAMFDLENYQRGRFEKSEPTIVDGDDLDIPTFLRKGIKINSPNKR